MGCPVGAFVCDCSNVQAVRSALFDAGWIRSTGAVESYDGPKVLDAVPPQKCKAVFTNAIAAEAMRRGAPVPPAIAELLEAGRVAWIHGHRKPTRPFQRGPRGEGQFRWFTFAELFAGVGGFRVALEPLGGECVFASEIADGASAIYTLNHGDVPAGDMTGIEARGIPPHDLLVGGSPCQSFSVCGDQNGLEDPRGLLFLEFVRVLRHCRPRAALIENVANVTAVRGGADFQAIVQSLQDAGYTVHWRVLSSAHLVPQRRNRLYIVAFRDDLGPLPFAWPQGTGSGPRPGQEVVADILEPEEDVPASYTLSEDQWLSILRKEPMALTKRCLDVRGQANTIMGGYRRSFQRYSHFVPPPESMRAAGVAVPVSVTRVLPRFLTERECARLMGFPDAFRISDCGFEHHLYHLLGNAVVPPVITSIAQAVLRALPAPKDATGLADGAAAAPYCAQWLPVEPRPVRCGPRGVVMAGSPASDRADRPPGGA